MVADTLAPTLSEAARALALVLATVLSAPHGASAQPGSVDAGDRIPRCPRTGPVHITGTIRNPLIDEISGLAVSHRFDNTIWAQEDSGNGPYLYAFGASGKRRSRKEVIDATNFDWEDLALADGKLWIGDIGDNARIRNEIRVWWFPEPRRGGSTVRARMLTLHYPHGKRFNAEALIVHGRSEALFVFTKENDISRVFATDVRRLRDGALRTLHRVATIGRAQPLTDVTAADVGPLGIVVKGWERGYLYPWTRSGRVPAALRLRPCSVPVGPGEAIGFGQKGRSWFTIPEGSTPSISKIAVR